MPSCLLVPIRGVVRVAPVIGIGWPRGRCPAKARRIFYGNRISASFPLCRGCSAFWSGKGSLEPVLIWGSAPVFCGNDFPHRIRGAILGSRWRLSTGIGVIPCTSRATRAACLCLRFMLGLYVLFFASRHAHVGAPYRASTVSPSFRGKPVDCGRLSAGE